MKKSELRKMIQEELTEVAPLLKQKNLSSVDYQKAKKLKDFNPEEYNWDEEQKLYVKEGIFGSKGKKWEKDWSSYKKSVIQMLKNKSIIEDPHFYGNMQNAHSDKLSPVQFIELYKKKFPDNIKEGTRGESDVVVKFWKKEDKYIVYFLSDDAQKVAKKLKNIEKIKYRGKGPFPVTGGTGKTYKNMLSFLKKQNLSLELVTI